MDTIPLPLDIADPCWTLDSGFTEFVRTSSSTLLRKAYLLSGSRDAAEDLVQDTLLRLYPRWERVESADVPIAYVQRSLTNNFINQRRRGRHREIVTAAVPDRPDGHNVERDAVDRDEVSALLRTLGGRQRSVLVMRFYEGLSDAEIADHLGVRTGTVRSLASRGLSTLRQRLRAA